MNNDNIIISNENTFKKSKYSSSKIWYNICQTVTSSKQRGFNLKTSRGEYHTNHHCHNRNYRNNRRSTIINNNRTSNNNYYNVNNIHEDDYDYYDDDNGDDNEVFDDYPFATVRDNNNTTISADNDVIYSTQSPSPTSSSSKQHAQAQGQQAQGQQSNEEKK